MCGWLCEEFGARAATPYRQNKVIVMNRCASLGGCGGGRRGRVVLMVAVAAVALAAAAEQQRGRARDSIHSSSSGGSAAAAVGLQSAESNAHHRGVVIACFSPSFSGLIT